MKNTIKVTLTKALMAKLKRLSLVLQVLVLEESIIPLLWKTHLR